MRILYRSKKERIIAGVCCGFAEYFSVDPLIVRLLCVFLTLFGGSGLLAYILAVLLIPSEDRLDEPPLYRKFNLKITKPNLWGLILIIVGIMLILQYNKAIGLFISRFWGFGFNVIVAIILIGLGIFYFTNRKTNIAKKVGLDNVDKFHLSETDRVLLGVCGGVAENMNLDSSLVRFVWAFGTVMSVGAGLILYLVFAFIMSKKDAE